MPSASYSRGRAMRVATVRHRVMEGGVEAGDLRQVRPRRGDGADRRQVVRLVQRRQRHQRVERGQQRVGDARGARVVRAAMHDAMADGEQAIRRRDADPPSRAAPRAASRAFPAAPPASLGQSAAVGIVRDEMRRITDLLDLTPQQTGAVVAPARSNSANLMLDEPAFSVSTASGIAASAPSILPACAAASSRL